MNALLRKLIDICLLRAGPQDLPWSLPLTRALVVASLALDLLYVTLLGSERAVFGRLLLSLALLLGVPWLLLGLRGRRERYVQTLAALCGTGMVFTVVFLPLALLMSGMPPPSMETPPEPGQLLLGWLTLAMLAWKLSINAHIYRHALDLRLGLAMLVAVGLFVLELGLDRLLFGPVVAS